MTTPDAVMALVYRYTLARIMANAGAPTKGQREVAEIVAAHESDRQEVARLDRELRAALAELAGVDPAQVRNQVAEEIATAIDAAGDKAKAAHYKAALRRAASLARAAQEVK